MAEEPPDRHRPPTGRNKSFRRARQATEEAMYRQAESGAMEDLQKYFSPDAWRKMTGLNLTAAQPSASLVQKYFEPSSWEKLQQLGCLGGPGGPGGSGGASASPEAPVTAARGCFSPQSWDALVRLNVVPSASAPQTPSDEDDDDILERCMDDDSTSLSSAVRLDGVDEGPRGPRGRAQLEQYFSPDQLRFLEEQGVLHSALKCLGRETSV